ncbi:MULTISPECIES: BLUF domain-containing protein [unclassified Marinomonas]|uniref:BLUF domain-containing protein n=1 Tax=unclassified Marinomonas TaxID=196814 RepID=UPI0007AFC3BC|nr:MULTISPECIES: BLUF domain-containing protein [unclassified Marinomonas]
MYELLYTSVARKKLTEDTLLDIMTDAKKNNSAMGVTGMLVYYDCEIMQILEGNKLAVESLYKKISQDERHSLVEVFYSGEIKERAFNNWSMESVILDEQKLKKYLYSDHELVPENPLQHMVKSNPNQGKKIFLTLRDTL